MAPLLLTTSRRDAGFTVVELVVVMLLMSVIAAIGMSRFADREPFAVQGLADQLRGALRLAQATAVAQRRSVWVALQASPPALNVCLDAACMQPLPTPAGEGSWLGDAAGVRLDAPATFSFGADGVPSLASTLVLRVVGDTGVAAAAAVTIEAGSGHVH